MKLYTALTVMRLGAFITGCAAFAAGSHLGWAYSGWLLVPAVAAGLMCCSLYSDGPNRRRKPKGGNSQ